MTTQKYQEKFDEEGYYKIKNFVEIDEINEIIKEINLAEDIDIYKDRSNNIRRIERIYNKGKTLNKLNNSFINLIKKNIKLRSLDF